MFSKPRFKDEKIRYILIFVRLRVGEEVLSSLELTIPWNKGHPFWKSCNGGSGHLVIIFHTKLLTMTYLWTAVKNTEQILDSFFVRILRQSSSSLVPRKPLTVSTVTSCFSKFFFKHSVTLSGSKIPLNLNWLLLTQLELKNYNCKGLLREPM